MKKPLLLFTLIVGLGMCAGAQGFPFEDYSIYGIWLQGGRYNDELTTSSDILGEGEDAYYVQIYRVQVPYHCNIPCIFTLGGTFDTYLYLMDEDFEVVARDDDDNDHIYSEYDDSYSYHSVISAQMKAGKTYYLVVTSYYSIDAATDDNNLGEYTLTSKCAMDMPMSFISDLDFSNRTIDLNELPLTVNGSFADADAYPLDNSVGYMMYHVVRNNKVESHSNRLYVEGDDVLATIIYKTNTEAGRLEVVGMFTDNDPLRLMNLDVHADATEYYMMLLSENSDATYTINAGLSGLPIDPYSLEPEMDIDNNVMASGIDARLDASAACVASTLFDSAFLHVYSLTAEDGKIYDITLHVQDADNRALSFFALNDNNMYIETFLNSLDEEYITLVGGHNRIFVFNDVPMADEDAYWDYRLTFAVGEPTDFYIDAETGDNENSGLSPQEPLASLEKALTLTDGIGRFHLMSDITVGDVDGAFGLLCELLPYQRDITITTTTEDGMGEHYGVNLTIGDRTGAHRITLGAVEQPYMDYIYVEGSLKMYYTTAAGFISHNALIETNGSLTIDHSRFTNNQTTSIYTIGDATVTNSRISDSEIGASIYSLGGIIRLIDDTVVNNTCSLSAIAIVSEVAQNYGYTSAIVEIDGGIYEGNTTSKVTVPSSSVMMIGENAEFWAGSRCQLNDNDIVLLYDGATINFANRPEAEQVCKILPLKGFIGDYVEYNYVEGLRVVGNEGAHSSHVGLAQYDTQNWYISNNGLLTTTEPAPEPEPGPNGIDNAQAAMLTLYPNPATTIITLNGDIVSQARDIEVLSMLGQTLLRQPATQSTLNLQSLSAGVYLLRLTDGNGAILAKQRFVLR